MLPGLFLLALCVTCGSQKTPADPLQGITMVIPVVVREIPHDTLSFTQGLVYSKGLLYESTGAPDGRTSRLRVIDAKDGRIVRENVLPADVFAEGLAKQDGKLVQLSWRNQIAFIYSFPDCAPLGTAQYTGEGWGLTWNGSFFVMSNGSDTLYYRDRDFGVRRTTSVRVNGQPLKNLNELEWVDGMVYANVWYSAYIFQVNPAGAVRKIIDCSGLIRQIQPASEHAVLNGIAYDDSSKTFYLTGKDWRAIFEVTIPK